MGFGGQWWLGAAGALALLGCASAQRASSGEGAEAPPIHRFVDDELGFAIERPEGVAWTFGPGQGAPEGILVPVVILHPESGAQVVVQVAPGIATADEFAGRLAIGLQGKPGFRITELVDLPDGGAGFEFTLSELVFGRVRVREGTSGQVFVLLGTWPATASDEVVADVDRIMASLKPLVPPGGVQAARAAPGQRL